MGEENDWGEPWVAALATLNRISAHSVVIFILFALSKLGELGLKWLSPPDGFIVLKGTIYAIPMAEVLLDFDFVLAIIFLFVLLAQVVHASVKEIRK